MKNILVIGSGGREHAICQKFSESKHQTKIFALPGNAGIAQVAELVTDIKPSEHTEIAKFCKKNEIDFVFVGPEQPLVDGIVDDLQQAGIAVFGTSKKAAQLEGSKVFMKKIVSDAKVPTAAYEAFTETAPALDFAKKLGFPTVIKTDGLAAGKGVIIAQDAQEAEENIKEIFAGKFGKSGKKIIIEEFLDGFEVSYFVMCDGKNFVPLGFAHDHKRVGDNDTGLNTGGMGTYAPSPLVDEKLENEIIETMIKPTLSQMEKEGAPFSGILFAGLMIGSKGPKLLEYNIRFGDPETQVVLPLIKSDFVDLTEAAIAGKLNEIKVEISRDKSLVCVVMCANGYPGAYQKGTEIKNLESLQNEDGVTLLHAGTVEVDGKILANGGRVLNIVAEGNSFGNARQKAYDAIDKIDWEEGFCRRDIALKSIINN